MPRTKTPAKRADPPSPDPDESESEFMDRCTAGGSSEQDCQAAWDDQQADNEEEGPVPGQQDMLMRGELGYPHILQAAASTPWAILSSKLAVIMEVLAMRAAGRRFSTEEIRERIGAGPPPGGPRNQGSVAVLPLQGTLIPRASMLAEASGATSLERWTASLRAAVADPSVGSVVIDIDSPGGSVFGVQECFDAIRAMRGGKPIVAVANSMAASAAYWLASACDELVVTPSGEVGSIGVIAAHEDLSAALQQQGVKVSLISAGKYKAEGSPFEPLATDTREFIQSRVDDYYAMFTRAVAKGRGASAAAVRDGFGQGRLIGSAQAVQMGMADRVGTLEDTVSRLARGTWQQPTRGASSDAPGVWVYRVSGPAQPPENGLSVDIDAAPYQPEPYAPDADETVKCPECGKMNDPDAKFCDQCGAKLTGRDDVKTSQAAPSPLSLDMRRRRLRRRGIPA